MINFKKFLPILLYLLFSVFAVLPFSSNGFFAFHDDVQVARVYEMAKMLSSGAFPVRGVPDQG
jgi:hypothetical protein